MSEEISTPMSDMSLQEESNTEATCTDTSEIKVFRCKDCFFESDCFKTLYKHGIDVHDCKMKKKYSCDKCLYSAAKKWKLLDHLKYHQNLPGITLFECHVCPFRAPIKCQLDRHLMFIHWDEPDAKKYKCHICSSEFRSKSSLATHKKTHK